MKQTLLIVSFVLISHLIQAQSVCEDVDREYHLRIISKEFKGLPADSLIETLEKKYFPLASLANCLFLLQANITDKQETRAIYRRVRDIALGYIAADTLILLTDYYNSGKVTEIFNRFAQKYNVRYISMGANCCGGQVWEAMGHFNGQIECHLIDVNGQDWKKSFHTDLEAYYQELLNKMSRKERKKIKKNYY